MTTHWVRSRRLAASSLMAACMLIGNSASGAFIAVRDYDENTAQANTIEKTAAGSNVTLAQFKADIEAAFDAGLGGVINYDNDPTFLIDTAQENFDVTFAGGTKTLSVDRDGTNRFSLTESVGATPISGSVWSGLSGSNTNATLVFSLAGVGGAPAPLVEWGITTLSRTAARDYTFTFTLDDASTVAFPLETAATPVGSDDTFFGYKAPSGRTIASVNIVSSGTMAFDDMAFIIVPEPSSIVLLGIAFVGLYVAMWRRAA